MSMLTKAKVDALLAQPSDKWRHITDGKVDGLALRISPSGFGSWSVDYTRPCGLRSRFTIGDATGEEKVTLADARDKAIEIRGRAKAGDDPYNDRLVARLKVEQEKQQAEAERRKKADRLTVEGLSQKWLASSESKKWRPASRASFEGHLRHHIVPAIGEIEAATLTKARVRQLLDDVHTTTPVGSNRVLETLRACFNWGVGRDLLTSSPMAGIKKLEDEREHRRERTYTDEELRRIAKAVKGSDIEDLLALLLRCGTRSHETRAARWSDIDFDRKLWVIPAEHTKSNRRHEVPLAPGAWAIISRRHEQHGSQPWVFPRARKGCPVCGQAGHMAAPLNRRLKAFSVAAGFQNETIRPHDLRRTCADRLLGVLGVAPHVVDAVLAHAAPTLTQTYSPSGVGLHQVAAALAAWDSHLTQALAGEKRRATVTAISSGRRRRA